MPTQTPAEAIAAAHLRNSFYSVQYLVTSTNAEAGLEQQAGVVLMSARYRSAY